MKQLLGTIAQVSDVAHGPLVLIMRYLCDVKDFLKVVNAFLLVCIFLTFETGLALYLKQFESPLRKDALCQVWLKLALWFWRKISKFVNAFLIFYNDLPLMKGLALHMKKL